MKKNQNCVPCIKAENEASRFSLQRTINKALEVGKQQKYTIMVTGFKTLPSGKKHFVFRPIEEGAQGLEQVQYHSVL